MRLLVLGSREQASEERSPTRKIALIGPPNVGKSAIFARLVGFGRRSANALGTTQDVCTGCVTCRDEGGPGCAVCEPFELIDLPGVFSIDHQTSEARLCRATLGLDGESSELVEHATAVAVVIEAVDPTPGLRLVGEVARAGLPTVVVVNMLDEAEQRGAEVHDAVLRERLGCPVVCVSARRSTGLAELRGIFEDESAGAVPAALSEPEIAALATRAVAIGERRGPRLRERLGDGFDAIATHPVGGAIVFLGLALALLRGVFLLAEKPSEWFEGALVWVGGVVGAVIPEGLVRDLVAEGIFGGVGGVVVFVPQIALTFVVLAILENTGYLSRATLAVDRLLRPFGLSGRAFMPMLTSYGCAIPAVIAARSIPCKRERLATILALPFTGCPARIPVYVLVASALFPDSGLNAALAFIACYAVGAAGALLTALVVRRTIARGESLPMIVEMPPYRMPSLLSALRVGLGRSWSFLKKAGTLILAASVVMWSLETIRVGTDDAGEPVSAMDAVGGAVQPAFEPLGFDDELTVATLVSFAARELFVSSMAVQRGIDEETTGEQTLRAQLAGATRPDGSPVFDTGTSWAVLLFFALSTQCLSTLVIIGREARSWTIPIAQFLWAFALAYGAGALAHALLS